jgi:hypothetical protein
MGSWIECVFVCDRCNTHTLVVSPATDQPEGWSAVARVQPPLADLNDGTRQILCPPCTRALGEFLLVVQP